MEAAVDCNTCFNDKLALERQKANLKVRVEARGVTVNKFKETNIALQEMVDWWASKYATDMASKEKEVKDSFKDGKKLGKRKGRREGAAAIVVVAGLIWLASSN